MPIRRLPPLLVNQIAAGEVIERPASVVKELIENAIDAGATRIEVAIENGGRDLIRVSDDGSGIPADELPLAVAAHATSKVYAAEDLESIATMGFRGEALASVASVSRLTIVSRAAGEDAAAQLDVEGGEMSPVRPAGAPPGTSVTVRNLFFNTPARRKFLRTDQTEASRIVAVVENLAVSHPGCGFRLTVDTRTRLDLPADQGVRDRMLAVVGEDLAEELLEIDARTRGIGLTGLIGTPAVARPTARHCRVYLNGRPITDRTILHAIREAYRGLIAPDRHPAVVLLLSIDPAEVDVNVHPAKSEVRFRQQSHMHSAVRESIVNVLRAADLVPALDLGRAAGGGPAEPKPFGSGFGEGVGQGQGQGHGYGRELAKGPPGSGFVYRDLRDAVETDATAVAPIEATPLPTLRGAGEAIQVHDSYVVTEDEQGLVIIDQHALHERVMFEKLCARIAGGELESQRLLMPVTIEVDTSQMEALERLGPLLARIGIEAEPIGPRTVAVHAFPSLLFERRVEPSPFMIELLSHPPQHAGDADSEAALHEVLDMMSCKAAIKAGDRLTPTELAELLAWRETVERSTRCPHGRPTTLRLTLADLEKQFGRR